MIKSVGKGISNGQMEINMKDSGLIVKDMVMVLVQILKMIFTKENGSLIKKMERESRYGQIIISMMECGARIKEKARVL